MRLLITGGTGLIGRYLTARAAEAGLSAVVYARRRWPEAISLASSVEAEAGDVRDLPRLLEVVQRYNVNVVVHLAGLLTQAERYPSEAFAVNVGGTWNVLETARLLGVQRVIFASSSTVYGEAHGPYGYPVYQPIDEDYPAGQLTGYAGTYAATKRIGEMMGRAYADRYGLIFIALRIGPTFGPGPLEGHDLIRPFMEIVDTLLAGEDVVVPAGGDECIDLSYAADIADGILKAATTSHVSHVVYNLASGQPTSLKAFGRVLQDIFPARRISIGSGLDFLGKGKIYRVLNISRARRELGFEPQWPLPRAISDLLDRLPRAATTTEGASR